MWQNACVPPAAPRGPRVDRLTYPRVVAPAINVPRRLPRLTRIAALDIDGAIWAETLLAHPHPSTTRILLAALQGAAGTSTNGRSRLPTNGGQGVRTYSTASTRRTHPGGRRSDSTHRDWSARSTLDPQPTARGQRRSRRYRRRDVRRLVRPVARTGGGLHGRHLPDTASRISTGIRTNTHSARNCARATRLPRRRDRTSRSS